MLRELDEVAVVGEVAGATTALAVVHERWAGHEAEGHVTVADVQLLGGVARGERETLGRGGERAFDDGAIEFDGAARVVHVGTDRAQRGACSRRHQLDADLLEDAQRGEMDRLDLVRRQDLERRVRVDDARPGQLRQTSAAAAAGAAARSHDRDRISISMLNGESDATSGIASTRHPGRKTRHPRRTAQRCSVGRTRRKPR